MLFLDVIFLGGTLIFGHQFVNFFIKKFNIPRYKNLLIGLFYYHLLIAFIYALYVKIFGGDALGYWGLTRLNQFMPNGNLIELHVSGTPFIYLMVYPFAGILGLSYWTVNLLFSLFGFVGIVFLFLTIVKTGKSNVRLLGVSLFPLILFLPNMHFWSAGVGKDSVMFFALTLFVYSLTNPLKNIIGLAISLYLAFFIRPHFALLMIVGMGFSMLTSIKGVAVFWRVVFLAVSIFLFVVVSPAVFEFIQLDTNELEQLDDLSNIRSKNLSRGSVGSAIDIKNYSMPVKILTFLFRPLFFDAPNLFGFIVSLENLFYLILGLTLFRWRNFIGLFTLPTHLKAALFVLGSAAFFMSSSLSNLGIIIRQKNMVMFMFVLITFYLLSKTQSDKVNTRVHRLKRKPGLRVATPVNH